ncbi:MAG TPA: SDR family oxidoreductase [Chloroflexi bacterium]|nr:SDR family oxidoreductase [Chloroflexota bacterium]
MGVLDRFSLQGRTALVTGAGRGIGYALAQALAEAGADVACVDIDGDSARRAAEELARQGVRTLGLQADVTRKDEVIAAVSTVVNAWGRLDIGVNNAGIARGGKAEDLSEEAWDAVLEVNLKAVFLCCQAEAHVMLPQGYGKIINTASMSATIVNRPQCQANYNAAKAGVVQLTRSCAAEWASRGVRVNCISPGHTVTPMTANMGDDVRAIWLSNTPMGRLGDPSDLQGAVVYLASEASDYVTGHDLIIDGGYVLW